MKNPTHTLLVVALALASTTSLTIDSTLSSHPAVRLRKDSYDVINILSKRSSDGLTYQTIEERGCDEWYHITFYQDCTAIKSGTDNNAHGGAGCVNAPTNTTSMSTSCTNYCIEIYPEENCGGEAVGAPCGDGCGPCGNGSPGCGPAGDLPDTATGKKRDFMGNKKGGQIVELDQLKKRNMSPVKAPLDTLLGRADAALEPRECENGCYLGKSYKVVPAEKAVTTTVTKVKISTIITDYKAVMTNCPINGPSCSVYTTTSPTLIVTRLTTTYTTTTSVNNVPTG